MAFAKVDGPSVSEDEPGKKWDRCTADALIKTGISSYLPFFGILINALLNIRCWCWLRNCSVSAALQK